MAFLCKSGENSKVSLDIEKTIKDDKKTFLGITQVLLLGSGESGKSTIFKQLKILQENGLWTTKELQDFCNTIYINIITQLQVLIDAAETLGVPLQPENIQLSKEYFELNHTLVSWSKKIGEDSIKLWNDSGIKTTFEKRDKEFQLNDSAEYFFNSLQRITQDNYIPTAQDALRARVTTKGIIEADVTFDHINMKIIDVGGQRSQRRKWIHCFDKVSAVIYVAGLSEYDQSLREDTSVNKMDESLSLFKEICNSKWFDSSSMILFLNKKDMFIEKLKRVPFNTYDKKYTGENTFEALSIYIQRKFESVKTDQNKKIYTHFTIAVDTENIEFVFKVIKKILVGNVMDLV
ncbi:hypothetical protein RB653_001657 [Dictyostelium firmibasis]|uniref:Uncharacterized protein n=1 Tax=Dictyostelium firmibasis TaxID=79012 RepID=A0AAN7U4E1_9MYCE